MSGGPVASTLLHEDLIRNATELTAATVGIADGESVDVLGGHVDTVLDLDEPAVRDAIADGDAPSTNSGTTAEAEAILVTLEMAVAPIALAGYLRLASGKVLRRTLRDELAPRLTTTGAH